MVATRRGVRVLPPSKTTPEQPSEVQATPSTGRVTRRAAKQAESDAQHAQAEEKSEGERCMSPTVSLLKRCTRASRLHSPEQPSTPMGSIHGGDVSDVESLCSAVSDKEVTPPRTTRRRKQPRAVIQEDEISEVESCSSAVSASNTGRRTRRTPRRKVIPESSDPARIQAADTKVDVVPEAESCSSVATETQRVTRSQRKTARTRSSAKEPEDSELSDTDSYLSSASGAGVSMSTRRRATRSRKQTGSIPIHLDEAAESSAPSTPTRRSSRTIRGRAAGTASEPQSCDSEGFESGPSSSLKKGKARPLDSDSEQSLIGSPCSTRGRGTPCSSCTGSGNSSQGTRRSVRQLCVVIEKGVELAEEDTSLNDSQLENTVIAGDADCTLLEEDQSETIEEKDDVSVTNQADTITEKKEVHVSEEDSTVSEISCSAKEVSTPVVIVHHQQRELREDNKEENTSEMERMQETSVSEQTEPCQSFTAAVCEWKASDEMEDGDKDLDAADVDACLSQGGEDEDAVVETRPSEEKMDVGPPSRDGHQVFDSSEVQVEAIQVTSSQQPNVTVDSGPERQPKDTITVQSRKPISLLESSEDEEDEEEEEEERELSEEECLAEERAGPSSKSDRAGMAMDGLFMIDTRPGQEADEHYYMEKETEEEKTAEEIEQEEDEQEEFVDEEEEDDDEEASILFASRNPLLKEMSSRIDPGIRVKELGGLYINFDGSKSKPVSSSLQKLKEKKIQDEVMKKSVIGADFEKKDAVPPYKESKHALKLKHREEKQKSTGDAWFNMKAPELTQELKGDLQVLKMRGSLDSKRFYKKNDRDGFPKYFQIGTVVDNPADFYHSHVPKKDRKRTMVEELLADAEFRHNNKKKYQQIMVEKAALRAGRKNKKKNKFSNKK